MDRVILWFSLLLILLTAVFTNAQAADTHPTYTLTEQSRTGWTVSNISWQDTQAVVTDATQRSSYTTGGCTYAGEVTPGTTPKWNDTATGANVTLSITAVTTNQGCSNTTSAMTYSGGATCSSGTKTSTYAPVMCIGAINCPKNVYPRVGNTSPTNPPPSLCNSSTGCEIQPLIQGNVGSYVNKWGTTKYVYVYIQTGQACDIQTEPSSTPATSADLTGSQGDVVSLPDPNAPLPNGCISMNGQTECVNNIPDNNCMSGGSGASAWMLCGNNAATPPSPDNGTPGVPANPEFQITKIDSSTGASTTYNYYSSSSVSNSTTGTTGSSPIGTGGNGSCGGQGQPECSGSGALCTSDPSNPLCQTTTINSPALDSGVPSIGDSATALWSGIQGSPLVSAVNALAFSDGSGSCPTPTFSLFGQTIVMDAQCTIMSNNAATISNVTMAMWSILAIFILFSA